ncbi:trypsin-like serine protease [Mesorhizobium sp. M0757]|uniref:S1 family peptidase n=1 Tax=Mesorhizobium sp. M0757 TaxID=2956993 RepID=UPI003334DA8B
MHVRILIASVLTIVLVCSMGRLALAQDTPTANDNATAQSDDPAAELLILRKVFRGASATAGQFRFHAAIGIRQWKDGPYDYLCGASLVAPRWLVSARHCFKKSAAGGLYKAQIATLEYAGFSDSIAVEDVYVYVRAQDEAEFLGDIVLLRLAVDAPTRAAPIPLQDKAGFDSAGHEHSRAEYTILGFGESTAGGGPVSRLQAASNIPSEPSDLCRKLDIQPEGTLVYGNRVVADTICAGNTNDPIGSDACKGDSGGGLIYDPTGSHPVLAGVVSGASSANDYGCNNQRIKVGLYSRIASYHDQIVACIASIDDPACHFARMSP